MASLEQRLASILPEQLPVAQAGELELEPMPAEMRDAEAQITDTSEPGTPNMDGVQLAGLRDIVKGGAKVLRDVVTDTKPRTRAAMQEEAAATAAAKDAAKAMPEVKPAAEVKVEPAFVTPTPAKIRSSARAAPGTGKPSTGEVINYDLFDDKSVAKYVQSIAKDTAVDYTRITKDQVLKQVEALGFDDAYLRGMDGQTKEIKDIPSTVLRAAFAVPAQVDRLQSVMKRIKTEGETPELMQMLIEQYALSAHVIKEAKGITSTPAQALAILNQGRPVMNVDEIKKLAADPNISSGMTEVVNAILQLTDDAAKAKLVDKVTKVGLLKDVWFSTYINGLLSSPVSHAKNISSNTAFGLYQIPERLVAAMYSNVLPDKVRSWRSLVPGSANEKIGLDEALTMIQSLRNGVREGLEVSSIAFRKNEPVMDVANKLELPDSTRMTLPEQLRELTGAKQDSLFGKGLDYYGTAVGMPGRALLSEDEFFKAVLYRMELNAQVTRRGKTVYRDAIDSGMSEADALTKAEAETISLMKNPPDDLDEAAMEFARIGTFTADLPPALEKLQQVFNHPALKIVVPFFKTPANIGLNVIERTPFAPLSSRWTTEMAKGGVYRDMALAKVTLGSTVLAAFATMAAEGLCTGRGPERKADREALIRDGWQPYSCKVGDTYFSYSGMEPVSALLAIASDYAEYARHEPDASKVEEVFLGGVYGMYEYLKEQPYLQGIADIAKLIGAGQQGGAVDGKKIVDGLAKQFGGFVIGGSPAPGTSSLVAGIERILDPSAKDTRASPDLPMALRGFAEAFNKYRSRLPYFNTDLPDNLNLWGDPIQQGRGMWYEIVLPTKVSPQQFSEVDDALQRIGSPVGMPERKIDGVEMTAQQYNRLLTIYGKELPSKEKILETIQMPGFDLLSLDDQQKQIQHVHSQYMDFAKKQLKAEDPELMIKIEDIKELRKANGLYYKPD